MNELYAATPASAKIEHAMKFFLIGRFFADMRDVIDRFYVAPMANQPDNEGHRGIEANNGPFHAEATSKIVAVRSR